MLKWAGSKERVKDKCGIQAKEHALCLGTKLSASSNFPLIEQRKNSHNAQPGAAASCKDAGADAADCACQQAAYPNVQFAHLVLWTSGPRAAKLFCVGRCIHGCSSNNNIAENLNEKFQQATDCFRYCSSRCRILRRGVAFAELQQRAPSVRDRASRGVWIFVS
jgi:hypothetical protein